MTDFVTRSLLLGKMRENNTFADAVRAAHTGDLQGLAFILRCAGSTIVSLGRVSDFAAELIASFEELCAELDAADAADRKDEDANLLDCIEEITCELGLDFSVTMTEKREFVVSAGRFKGVDTDFRAAMKKALVQIDEDFYGDEV